MPIYNIIYCIIVGEFTGINSLKYFVLYFISTIVVDEMEASNLYKTFLNLLL
jgi:hypothetical protein